MTVTVRLLPTETVEETLALALTPGVPLSRALGDPSNPPEVTDALSRPLALPKLLGEKDAVTDPMGEEDGGAPVAEGCRVALVREEGVESSDTLRAPLELRDSVGTKEEEGDCVPLALPEPVGPSAEGVVKELGEARGVVEALELSRRAVCVGTGELVAWAGEAVPAGGDDVAIALEVAVALTAVADVTGEYVALALRVFPTVAVAAAVVEGE